MPLKDLLKKRDKIKENVEKEDVPALAPPPAEFTFMRSDTNTQELIQPPSFAEEDAASPHLSQDHRSSKLVARFRSSSNASVASKASSKGEKRLSQRLHLRSSSRASSFSSNIPEDLPSIEVGEGGQEEKEAKWEERATILAKENPNINHSTAITVEKGRLGSSGDGGRPQTKRSISDAKGDETIQEAIKLHEAGDLERSTAMFGRLAEDNAMAQILYGLALRHGWGIPPNPSLAITYLSQAASNSAAIESQALQSGMKKGGAAKGELVLAMYELANSFRHGWGVGRDPVAARSYYETAANLGDTDAMNEVARCYEEGFGGKKDKVSTFQSISNQARWLWAENEAWGFAPHEINDGRVWQCPEIHPLCRVAKVAAMCDLPASQRDLFRWTSESTAQRWNIEPKTSRHSAQPDGCRNPQLS